MIRLTSKYTNDAFYVNPDHIVSIGNNNSGDTTVELTTDIEDAVRHVTESPAEVARKVLEWRLCTENRIYAFNNGEKDLASAYRRMMLKLAGLEEQA